MKENEKIDELASRLMGNKTLRRQRRSQRRRLRIIPNIPEVFRFIRDVANRTPLIPLLLVLSVLWLLFSLGVYLAEHNVNEQINSYGHALWWSFTAMQTQGANAPGPITGAGQIIGGIWSIFSTIAFFGIIIGTLYSYFMLPRRRPSRELVNAIQYNLEELENLSLEELEALKEITARLVEAHISRLKEKSRSSVENSTP
jgi:voltage-gated potassium channel